MARNFVKNPYLKLSFDILGIIAFIGVLILLGLNLYINTNGNFNAGISVTGTDMIIMNILVLTTIISASISYSLRKIR